MEYARRMWKSPIFIQGGGYRRSYIIAADHSLLPSIREQLSSDFNIITVFAAPKSLERFREDLLRVDGEVSQQHLAAAMRDMKSALYKQYDHTILSSAGYVTNELTSIVLALHSSTPKQIKAHKEQLLTMRVHEQLEAVKKELRIAKVHKLSALSSLNNDSIKMETDKGNYFFRIPGDWKSMVFAVPPNAERHNLQSVAELGLYPRIEYFNDEGCYAVHFLDGCKPLSTEVQASPHGLSLFAHALRTLHESPPFKNDYNPVDIMKQVIADLHERKVVLPRGFMSTYGACQKIWLCLAGLGGEKVPSHNDMNPYNVLSKVGGEAIWLTDFEWSGNNLWVWDITKLIVELNLPESKVSGFLAGYFGCEPSASQRTQVFVARLVVEFFMALWAKHQIVRKNSKLPESFFEKMFVFRIENCRKIMGSVPFSAAIDELGKHAVTAPRLSDGLGLYSGFAKERDETVTASVEPSVKVSGVSALAFREGAEGGGVAALSALNC